MPSTFSSAGTANNASLLSSYANRGEAQDAVQQACCKAFEHLDQYQGDAEFIAWLLQIVSNQCLMLTSDRRRTRFVCIDADSDHERRMLIELPSTSEDPEHEAIRPQLLHVFHKEIRRIPPLLRNVLMPRDVQAMPMRDRRQAAQYHCAGRKIPAVPGKERIKERMMKSCGPVRLQVGGRCERTRNGRTHE